MKKSISFLLAFALLAGMVLMPLEVHGAGSIKAGAVTTSGSSLNVRSSPSTSSAVLTALRNGSYVTLHGKSGDWWKVSYGKDRYGYCHEDYITIVQGTSVTVATQSGALNVRKGPGTSYEKIASLGKGETVLLLSTSGQWSRILYHGIYTGYVASQYLSSGVGQTSVSLSVPSFKQTDSRWANVTIGNSGKTIGKIGCATTAIAMIESYRSGRTIYPDAMARKLTYTSSGSVYWPSDYTPVTSQTGYLARIREQLGKGKPVLLGAKNSYGSQHWVVITGYSGGGTTAADFSVQDPGSNSRVDLQQFLSAYPVFYKYFLIP